MKVVDLTQARLAAEAMYPDPILKMAVFRVLDSLPVMELSTCGECDDYNAAERWCTRRWCPREPEDLCCIGGGSHDL